MKKIISDTIEDQEAWKKLQSGDIQSLELLYRKYLQELFRFGLTICPEEELIKDQIQEVFLEIWQYHSTICLPENCKFYLLRSLSNKIKRTKGSNLMQPLETYDFIDHPSLIDTSDLDKFLVEEKFLSQSRPLEKAFAALSQKQRKLIHLLFFENYSYLDASEILQINIRSTYTLAWKALKKLRKNLPNIILFSIIRVFFY